MTDKDIADMVYIEPLTPEMVKKVILKEKPDSHTSYAWRAGCPEYCNGA